MKKNKIYRYIVPALLAAAVLAAAVWLFLGARRTEEEVPAAESGSGLEEGQVLYKEDHYYLAGIQRYHGRYRYLQ